MSKAWVTGELRVDRPNFVHGEVLEARELNHLRDWSERVVATLVGLIPGLRPSDRGSLDFSIREKALLLGDSELVWSGDELLGGCPEALATGQAIVELLGHEPLSARLGQQDLAARLAVTRAEIRLGNGRIGAAFAVESAAELIEVIESRRNSWVFDPFPERPKPPDLELSGILDHCHGMLVALRDARPRELCIPDVEVPGEADIGGVFYDLTGLTKVRIEDRESVGYDYAFLQERNGTVGSVEGGKPILPLQVTEDHPHLVIMRRRNADAISIRVYIVERESSRHGLGRPSAQC